MNKLFFDTETTGLPDYSLTPLAQSARVVQLAAILLDSNDFVLQEMSLIIKPVNFTIPSFLTSIHGISQENADKYGFNVLTVLATFAKMIDHAELFIAHNIKFDSFLLDSEFAKAGMNVSLKDKQHFCTMLASTPLCGLKQGTTNRPKWPKVSEASTILLGEQHVDAHNAMSDLRTTVKIYKHLKKLGKTPELTAIPIVTC